MATYSSSSQMSTSYSSTGFITEQLPSLIKKRTLLGLKEKIRKLNGDLDEKILALLDQAFNSGNSLRTFVLRDLLTSRMDLMYRNEDLALYRQAIIKRLQTNKLDSLTTLDLSDLRMDHHPETVKGAMDTIQKCSSLASLRLNYFLPGNPPRLESFSMETGNQQLIEQEMNNPANVSARLTPADWGGGLGTVSKVEITRRVPGTGHEGNPDLSELSQVARSLPCLSSLSLQKNNILTAQAIESLQLNHFPCLTRLELNKNPFDNEAIGKIAEIFATNSSIVELDLSDCPLNPERLAMLGAMLQENTTLKILRSRKRKVQRAPQHSTIGISHLAEGLKYNTVLRVLDLTGHIMPSREFIKMFHVVKRDDSPIESLGDEITYGYSSGCDFYLEQAFVENETQGQKLSTILRARSAVREHNRQRFQPLFDLLLKQTNLD